MAWSAPMTAVANATFTAAQFNQYVRDNLNETSPAKATLANQYPVVTGTNAIAMRRVQADSEDAIFTTTSTSYTGTLPAVASITTGTQALVFLYCYATTNVNSEAAFFSYEVSGATTSAANDNRAIQNGRFTSQFAFAASTATLHTGLTAGVHAFTSKHRSTSGAATATFDHRRIAVMPF